MSLPPELTDLAEHLIANKRNDRNRRIETDLWTRQDDAVARSALGTAYAEAQKDACIRELNERANEIWSAYKRVINEASIPWSVAVRDALVARIANELEYDTARIEEVARSVITPPRTRLRTIPPCGMSNSGQSHIRRDRSVRAATAVYRFTVERPVGSSALCWTSAPLDPRG